MRSYCYRGVLNSENKAYVIPLGDVHFEDNAYDSSAFLRLINWIESHDNVYILGMGDYQEYLSGSGRDKLSQCYDSIQRDHDYTQFKRVLRLCKIFQPISNRIIGLLEGHHYYIFRTGVPVLKKNGDFSHWNTDYAGKTTTQLMCDLLHTQYLGDGIAFIRLIFQQKNPRCKGRYEKLIFATHGKGTAKTPALSLRQLEDLAKSYEADIYLAGHQHKKVASRNTNVMTTDRSGNIVLRPKIFARTGTFLRGYMQGYTTYVERALLPPSDVGVVKITFHLRSAADKMLSNKKKYTGKKHTGKKYLDIHVSE